MSKIEEINENYNLAVSYFSHAEELFYQFPKFELSSPDAKLNYESFITTLKITNPKDISKYYKLSFGAVTCYALGRMYELLGEGIPSSDFEELLHMCAVSNGEDPFECNYVEINGQKLLLFDRLDVYDSIPCVGHEASHHLQDKYCTLNNGYHCEVLSMLIELILSDEISTPNIDSNIYYKNIAKTINALKRLQEFVGEVSSYSKESNIPELRQKIEYIKKHREHMAYTYTVSFIYAYNLFLEYKKNPDKLLNELEMMFINNSSIDSIIQKYKLDFSNKETFVGPNKVLKSL